MATPWECLRGMGCYRLLLKGRVVADSPAVDEISRECLGRAAAALNAFDGVELVHVERLASLGGFKALCECFEELDTAAREYLADSDHYLGPISRPSCERLRRALLAVRGEKQKGGVSGSVSE